MAGYRDQIDAVAIAFAIGQIVAQMCPIHTNHFPIFQTSHILPINLTVSKTRPAMIVTLGNKFS